MWYSRICFHCDLLRAIYNKPRLFGIKNQVLYLSLVVLQHEGRLYKTINIVKLPVNKTFADSCLFNYSSYVVLLFSGYQLVLTNAHKDQSHSYLGRTWHDAVGSLWLTAFVVKCLELPQPYMYIDKTVLSQSIYFFARHQERDGGFPKVCI